MQRLIVLTLLVGSACKQSEGQRCQIDDDCDDGLECSMSEHICVPAGTAVADAAVDALIVDVPPFVDAAPVDATPPDAPPDAQFDADLTPDSSPPD